MWINERSWMVPPISKYKIEITEQDANMGVTDRTDPYIYREMKAKYKNIKLKIDNVTNIWCKYIDNVATDGICS